MAKPDLIKWVSGDEAAKITDPGATKKLAGFLYKEKPPFQYFNWLFNRLSKWLLGMQGSYFDIVVGSAAQVTNLEATHILSDLDDTLVTAGTKVLILDGTHTLLVNFSLANNSIKITSESVSAIIDVSTFTFTLSGNNVDAELKIINSGVDDIIISGVGSIFRSFDLPLVNVSASFGSHVSLTGLNGGTKNIISELLGCKVYLDANQLIATGSTGVPIIFTQEQYDTKNIHDNAVNPERLTVGPGVSFAKLYANIEFNTTGDGAIRMGRIYKNSEVYPIAGAENTIHSLSDAHMSICTGFIPVIEGDYFQLYAVHDSTGDIDVLGRLDPNNVSTWFSIEFKT